MRPARARNAALIAGMIATVLIAAACTSSPKESKSAPASDGCAVSADLVPSCGALIGISVGPSSERDIASLEKVMKRKVDILYEFHGIDKKLPARDEKQMVAQGRVLHVNIESKEFVKANHPEVAWREITGGRFDSVLKQQAKGFKKLKTPVMVTFDHEVDSAKKVGQRGTAAEFVAAWRHIHDVYKAAGATNVVWVWVVTGYEGNWDRVPAVYPGNGYVDWVSWDPYNFSGCQQGTVNPDEWKSFEDTVSPFYNWLQTKGAAAGIDPKKPYMLSEFGTVDNPEDPGAAGRWYAGIPSALTKFPQLKALQLWNGKVGTCDYRIEQRRETLLSFGALTRDQLFGRAAAALADRTPAG